jgi:hypothetical protein
VVAARPPMALDGQGLFAVLTRVPVFLRKAGAGSWRSNPKARMPPPGARLCPRSQSSTLGRVFATRLAIARLRRPRRLAAGTGSLLRVCAAVRGELRELPLPVCGVVLAGLHPIAVETDARASARLRPIPCERLRRQLSATAVAETPEAASRPRPPAILPRRPSLPSRRGYFD